MLQIFKQFVTNDNNLKFSTSYIKISIIYLLNNYKELNRGYPSVITPKKIEMYLTISCEEYIKFSKSLKLFAVYPRFESLKDFLNYEMIKCVLTSKECPKLTTQQDKEYYDYVFYSLWYDMASYLNNNPNDILNFFNCMLEENYEFMSLQINKYNYSSIKVIDFVIKDYYESIQQMEYHEGYINKEKIDRKIKERFINNILKYNFELDLQTGITNSVNAINKYIFEIYNKKGRIYIYDGIIKENHVSYITQEDLDKFLKYFLENINITLPFIEYITYKNSIPFLKDYKDRITKESIVQFLDRSEPTREEVQEWRELWAQQNPDDNNPPPPPDWWLRGRSADVHTKRHVGITDCRIKLLFERLPNDLDIDKIAEDIESETRRIATLLADDEKLTGEAKSDFIKKNTVTKQTILKCRLSENEYRLYGFGGVYEEQKVRSMKKEDQVVICSIVSKVWMVIKSTKSNLEMYNTLIMQFVGAFKEHIAQGVCNQGWVGGLTSIFGSYAKELGYLCLSEDEIEVEDLVQKFLDTETGLGKSDDVKYPTVHKQFVEIGNIIVEAKYDDEYLEEKHTDEEIANYKKKVQLYDDMYESADIEVRKKAMTEFISGMVPSFFMEVFEYYPNEDIVRLKKATKKAVAEYLQIELDKICGTRRR